jgi:hypothetical protein
MKLLIYSSQNHQITRSGKPVFILKVFFNPFHSSLKSIHFSSYLIAKSRIFTLGTTTKELLGAIRWCRYCFHHRTLCSYYYWKEPFPWLAAVPSTRCGRTASATAPSAVRQRERGLAPPRGPGSHAVCPSLLARARVSDHRGWAWAFCFSDSKSNLEKCPWLSIGPERGALSHF